VNRRTLLIAGIVPGVVVLVIAIVFLRTYDATSSDTAQRDESAHNVLLITLDTTRADRLGCYGYPKNTTPNLDALAADAVRFDRAISTSAITPVSHASILTGLNPYQHDVRVFFGPTGHYLSAKHPTLASVLQAQGWTTAAFISAYPASDRFGLHWGFQVFETGLAESMDGFDDGTGTPVTGTLAWARHRTAIAQQRRADVTTNETLKWLANAPRPFCLWVHYFDPHDPHVVPPKEVTDRWDYSPSATNAKHLLYDSEVFFMDAHLGRLLQWFRDSGTYDKTVIVVVADHGQGLGDHNWMQHRLLYQEQIRLPLIVRYPGGPTNLVVNDLVRGIDVAPTILELLDVETPASVEGRSLLPVIQGAPEPPRVGFAEALNTLDEFARGVVALPEHQNDLLFCAMDRTWKLIYHHNHPENSELYNLTDDPKEQHNVAATNREQFDRLRQWLADAGALNIRIVEPEAPLDEADRRKLESLGYIKGEN